MRLRIQKRAEIAGWLPIRDKTNLILGNLQPDMFPLWVDYTAIGEAPKLPTVGESFWMMQDTRNGTEAAGIFTTSPVTEVTDKTFRTKNSVYDYLVLTTNTESV